MFKSYAILALMIIPIILISGCINIDPEAIARANPIINQFLKDHPNADIRILHYSAEEAADIIDMIRDDCGKSTIKAKEFYFINITDQGFTAVAWIDWENMIIECAYKIGSPDQPISECIPKYKSECFGDYIYWFDSCGNKEIEKEFCPAGCIEGKCTFSDKICDIDTTYVEKPDCSCPSGYEMIVIYPKCAGGITGAITGMPVAKAVTTESGYVEIAEEYTTDRIEKCYGASPVYRCVKKQECKSHAQTKCYAGHAYWFDSCGHVQEKKEYCNNGCDNGFCKPEKTCEVMGGYCTNVACTEDARMCDDGTSVARVPPECEFAPCPAVASGSSGGGYSTVDSVTGMSTTATTEEETSETMISAYVCKEGYGKSEYWCPNNGICCIPERQECYDTDGGRNYHQKGVVEGIFGGEESRYEDSCCSGDNCDLVEGEYVLETYCEDQYIRTEKYECPYGCENGVCTEKTDECTDSDGGINIKEKGEVTTATNVYTDQCLGEHLIEHYCDNGDHVEKYTSCYCYLGVCYDSSECSDTEDLSDAPKWYQNKLVKGTVTVSYMQDGEVLVTDIQEDECVDDTKLIDLSCSPFDDSGEFFGTGFGDYIICENGCENGACLVECEGIEMVWYVEGVESRRDPDCVSDRSTCYNCEEFCYSFANDTCDSYRCLTGSEINPACYTFDECADACDTDCVNIPLAKEQC